MSKLIQMRRRAPKRKAPKPDQPEFNPIPVQPEEKPVVKTVVVFKRRRVLEIA